VKLQIVSLLIIFANAKNITLKPILKASHSCCLKNRNFCNNSAEKSQNCNHFTQNIFASTHHVHITNLLPCVLISLISVALQWDTAGQERFRYISLCVSLTTLLLMLFFFFFSWQNNHQQLLQRGTRHYYCVWRHGSGLVVQCQAVVARDWTIRLRKC